MEKYLNNFTNKIGDELKKDISYTIVQYCENTGFSPKYLKEKFEENDLEKMKKIFKANLENPLHIVKEEINLFR